jgi:hypothetical protein
MSFKIDTLARRTGTSAPTIRYYEEIGLLPRADRRAIVASQSAAKPASRRRHSINI